MDMNDVNSGDNSPAKRPANVFNSLGGNPPEWTTNTTEL